MVVILRRPRSKLANTLMVQTIIKVKSFPSSWRRSQWSFQASSSSAVIYLTRRPIVSCIPGWKSNHQKDPSFPLIVSVVTINWPAVFPSGVWTTGTSKIHLFPSSISSLLQLSLQLEFDHSDIIISLSHRRFLFLNSPDFSSQVETFSLPLPNRRSLSFPQV